MNRDSLQRLAFPAAVLGVLLLVFVLRPPPEDSAARVARVEPLRPVPSRAIDPGAGPAEQHFAAGMERYAAGRQGEALAELSEAIALGGEGWARAGEAKLYRGSCRLLSGMVEEARGDLQAAAADAAPEVSLRAKWHLAQAHLLLDDVDAARELLDELSRTPAYARPASEQLLLLRGK